MSPPGDDELHLHADGVALRSRQSKHSTRDHEKDVAVLLLPVSMSPNTASNLPSTAATVTDLHVARSLVAQVLSPEEASQESSPEAHQDPSQRLRTKKVTEAATTSTTKVQKAQTSFPVTRCWYLRLQLSKLTAREWSQESTSCRGHTGLRATLDNRWR